MTEHRDRNRRHDIVLWGATGFTGELVAEYLVEGLSETGVRLALAGRSRPRLEALRQRLAQERPAAAELPLVIADSHDRSSLDALAEETEVVCTTVGPYAHHGHELVAACVEAGTDYCDLTGEVPFIRAMIDRHHQRARSTGARIVHCCGFDSIPSDLGTLMLQEAAIARFGAPADRVLFVLGANRGGFSGGTVASLVNVIEEAKSDRHTRRIVGDPYALNPEGERHGPDGPDLARPRFDPELGRWTGPFVMAPINTRVVRRSNALAGWRYGRDFRYAEVTGLPPGLKGRIAAAALAGGLGAFVAALSWGPTRSLLSRTVLPAPGEGPSRETRDNGFFHISLHGTGTAAGGDDFTMTARIQGDKDPGYGETAKMLGESALCLALDHAKLDGDGGVLTPAAAMGMNLVDRLRRAGMLFAVA
ncbi:MAG: saccharopine dehydrogenase NADP-binding domain-containing protein [Thermoanaerobaculales bacterium]|nr:saccharopine dehydrogenase NADP-binding domain-containing protein [Thermoanaerobaculales bacterium]